MGHYTSLLYRLIKEYQLDRRDPWLVPVIYMLEYGRFSENMAKVYLQRVRHLVEKQERIPNFLMSPPTYEEMYPEESPDIFIGKLIEAPIPLGLSLANNVNSLIVGRSGCGKSTIARNIIKEIFKRNGSKKHKHISVLCFSFKGGDYADLPIDEKDCLHFDFEQTLRLGLNAPLGYFLSSIKISPNRSLVILLRRIFTRLQKKHL